MYIDLLVRIKNAQQAKKATLKMPFSKMDFAIAELLEKHRYLEGVVKKGRAPKRVLEVKLKYEEDGQGVIRGLKFLSKPSRRIYSGYRDFKKVKQGFGLSVISTPQGVMASGDAMKKKIGGQLLFEIW